MDKIEALDWASKYAKTKLNPMGYDKAIKILKKLRPKKKEHLIAYSNAEVILYVIKKGYKPIIESDTFSFEKDGKNFNIGIKTKTEFNFAIYLAKKFK